MLRTTHPDASKFGGSCLELPCARRLLAALVFAAPLSACVLPPPDQTVTASQDIRSAESTFPKGQVTETQPYRIGAHDVLDIAVFKLPELSKAAEVSSTGTISLPLVGELEAGGRTTGDVQHDLVGRLQSHYLWSPEVTVAVRDYNSQRITVEGGVRRPGVFPIKGRATLLQAVALAEGLSEASDASAIVFHDAGGKRTWKRFDIASIGAGDAEDPAVSAGDTVVVGESAAKQAFNNFIRALPVFTLFHF